MPWLIGPAYKPPCDQRTDNDRKALAHYTAAVTSMRSSKATTVEKLLTSFLGWTIEGLQGNLEKSRVHLNGLQALIDYEEQEQQNYEVREQFGPLLEHAQAVHSVMSERFDFVLNMCQRDDGSISLKCDPSRSEQSYAWIMSHILASRSGSSVSAPHPEAKIHDGIGEWLQSYIEARTPSHPGTTQSKPENALRLLNDSVATLLPHNIVAGIGQVDVNDPEHLLATVESCFNPMLHTSVQDYVQLLGTLRVVLDLSLTVWPVEPWRSCIQSLLRAVDVCERSCFEGRETVVPVRKKASGRKTGQN